jgi:hypothetical protein
MLVTAFLWPSPKRHVIPVDLTAPDEIGAPLDAAIRKRQDADDISRLPGLEAPYEAEAKRCGWPLAAHKPRIVRTTGLSSPNRNKLR